MLALSLFIGLHGAFLHIDHAIYANDRCRAPQMQVIANTFLSILAPAARIDFDTLYAAAMKIASASIRRFDCF